MKLTLLPLILGCMIILSDVSYANIYRVNYGPGLIYGSVSRYGNNAYASARGPQHQQIIIRSGPNFSYSSASSTG